MSKQKKNKQPQQISPENYIRTRARKLPIYKCWVNKDWKRVSTATVIISRKHVSGNLTLGIYIVDLLCLGVGETWYKYNIPEIKLTEMITDAGANKLRFVEIPYKLAHNIIYSAVEYAEKYGLHPVATFTRVSQYILEPDTEDIPLMHIHCGDEKGKPIYVQASVEKTARQKQILYNLRQTAGYDNYQYIPYGETGKKEELDEEKNKEVEDFNKIRHAYLEMSAEERKTQFVEFFANFDNISAKEKREMLMSAIIWSDVIIRDKVDHSKVREFIDAFKTNFNCTLISIFDLPNSYFTGLRYRSPDKLIKEYTKITDKLASDNFEQIIEKIRENYGDLPFVSYLELKYDKKLIKTTFRERVYCLSQKFPDYLMFKIIQCQYADHEKLETMLSKIREPVTLLEFNEFLSVYATCCIENSNYPFEKMVAFESRIYDKKSGNKMPEGLFLAISLIKIEIVKKYFGIKKQENPQTC
jgi:hypothetical protein